jgi:hypothetical protein
MTAGEQCRTDFPDPFFKRQSGGWSDCKSTGYDSFLPVFGDFGGKHTLFIRASTMTAWKQCRTDFQDPFFKRQSGGWSDCKSTGYDSFLPVFGDFGGKHTLFIRAYIRSLFLPLHPRQRIWMLATVLPPPLATGMMWSNSR